MVPKLLVSKTQVSKKIQQYLFNRNRTHYLKWVLDDEWSIRYILRFDTRPEHNSTWVLKSHFQKIYITLTKAEAIEYIRTYCNKIEPLEYFSINEFGKGYRRTIIDPINGVLTFIET